MAEAEKFKLSVCICTRNRPSEITRAIESLHNCRGYVHEVIVSDDSTNDETYDGIKNLEFPVRYERGPRRGLSANRNNALRFVTGTHVLFIDDDVVVSPEFIPNILKHYEGITPQRRARVIITGLENKQGELVFPHEQDFLGFQKINYYDSKKIRTVVINSTVFPVTVFTKINFDENLIYGYEEVDMATRASYRDFDIELCTTAINSHYPSEINRDFYQPYLHASRLYVTYKRYYYSEHRVMKAVLFAVVSVCHLIASSVMHQGVTGARDGARTVRLALLYTRRATRWEESPK